MSSLQKPFPGVGQALLCLLALWLLSGLFSLVNFIPGMSQGLGTFIGYTGSFGLFLWLLLVIRGSYHIEWQHADRRIYLLLLPATLAMLIINATVISFIPMPDSVIELFSQLMGGGWLSFVTVALAAPVLEELIFRGVILDSLLKRLSPVRAIIWSSVIFGIAHANPWQFIAAFSIGLIVGWLYYRTKSIWPGILLHFINNATASVLGELMGIEQSIDQQLLPGYAWVLWLAAIIVLAASLFAMRRYLPAVINWKSEEPKATHDALSYQESQVIRS